MRFRDYFGIGYFIIHCDIDQLIIYRIKFDLTKTLGLEMACVQCAPSFEQYKPLLFALPFRKTSFARQNDDIWISRTPLFHERLRHLALRLMNL